jgi:L-lactate dehydrogenase complex protein LldE
MAVDIFIPCYIDQLFPETGFNMVKVLRKAGVEVAYNPAQTCCGQPAFNAGFWKDARKVSEKFVRDFDTGRDIVAPSGSCVGFVRSYYGELFANSSIHNECKSVQQHFFELSEYLVKVLKKTDFDAVLEGKATYHDACGALRECRIKEEPRILLSKVKGLQLVEMEDVETCCGFGGTFSVKFEPISVSMAEQKIDHALATGAEYIISTDMSCLMHLDGVIRHKELPLKALHLADVLASGWG